MLIMAGRHQTVAVQHLGDVRNQLMQTVDRIDRLMADGS
jgi:hypothetical protein